MWITPRSRLLYRHQGLGLAALVTAAWIIPGQAEDHTAQLTASLTGTWEVTRQAAGRSGRPETLMLVQNPDGSLTGAFVVGRREQLIADGRVVGSHFSFSRAQQNMRYEGTITGDTLEGTIVTRSGSREVSVAFTGTRESTEVSLSSQTTARTPEPARGRATSATSPASARAGGAASARGQGRRGRGGQPPPAPTGTPGAPGTTTITIDGRAETFALPCRAEPGPGGQVYGGSVVGATIAVTVRRGPVSETTAPHYRVQTAYMNIPVGQYAAYYFQRVADGVWLRHPAFMPTVSPIAPIAGTPLEAQLVPAEGPLGTIHGNDLTVRGTFVHLSGSTHEIEITTSCESWSARPA